MHIIIYILVTMKGEETLPEEFFDGTAGKGPLQQRKMLSSQFCFPDRLWFDVFKDYSLQTCYGSMVYL